MCVCVSSALRSPSRTKADDCFSPFNMRLFEVFPEAARPLEPGLQVAHLMFAPMNLVDVGNCMRS